jgi:hypothetical protein
MTWDLVIEQIQFAFFGLLFAVITTGSRPQINVNVDASTIYRFDELIRKGLIPSVSTLITYNTLFQRLLTSYQPFSLMFDKYSSTLGTKVSTTR